MNYPDVEYPTIIDGKVWGPLRLESLDGSERYIEPVEGRPFVLKNYGPVVMDGKTWGVTHLQKRAKRGYLKVSPDCFHWWYTIRPQKLDENGKGIPGTEIVIYFRKPFSWRWDIAGTLIDGILRHWIWTKGYFGGHFD